MWSRRELLMWVLLTAAIIVAVIVILAQPVSGHSSDDIDAWLTEWALEADRGLTVEHLEALADFEQRHGWFFNPVSDRKEEVAGRNPSRDSLGKAPLAPDYLRGLVALYFPPGEVERALRVAWCESRYDPTAANPTSSARGLFQHLRYWYSGEGMPAFDPFNPEESVAAAHWLWNRAGSWRDWNASRHCWG